jgi:hypothetical protein
MTEYDDHRDGAPPFEGPLPAPMPTPAGRSGLGMLRAMPGIAKVATASAWNAMTWSVHATRATAEYVARRAIDGEPPALIMQEAAADLRSYAVRALGLNASSGPVSAERAAQRNAESDSELMRRGEELLRRSNDVHVTEETHPAFARMLTEITPDEARILRFLYLEGAQPSLDVRTFRPLGIGSELVAAGLNMIGEHAGCRFVERIDPYLTNLARLGLVDFSREQVENPQRYQVIEAQPKTVEALKRAGRSPKLIQRSVRLTSFGEEFVRICLPVTKSMVPERAARTARRIAEQADREKQKEPEL